MLLANALCVSKSHLCSEFEGEDCYLCASCGLLGYVQNFVGGNWVFTAFQLRLELDSCYFFADFSSSFSRYFLATDRWCSIMGEQVAI